MRDRDSCHQAVRGAATAQVTVPPINLGLERHGGRIPAGLWARVIQRLLALNACIWHNWLIGARLNDP
jgi:hypothetical protein